MNVIEQLDAEWRCLVHSRRGAAALAGWRSDDPAFDFPDLASLVRYVERRDQGPEAADAVLAALARRAPTDGMAARTLLQLLLPGCKAMLRGVHPRDRHERAALVVAVAYDRIRTYPIDRRPRRIAANVLLDTRQRVGRTAFVGEPTVPLDAVSERRLATATGDPEPGAELVRLLGVAVRRGILTAETARLIALTRVAGVPIADVARSEGTSEQTVRRRRLRAEERLRRAVAA
ncbi:MAG TPA: hypothetical protein VM618_04645 [Acidimicrobiia bacterium]|nr:hypothetical protein [Acidimicrobiia bacterium]